MKNNSLLIIFLLLAVTLKAQDYKRQKANFILANIGINGLAGGIGAAINKKPDEKLFKVMAKGFGQGCLGGGFNVLGKEITYQIEVKENLSYAWPARLTNAVGSSITQNAVANINFWERWHFNIGILRLDYNVPDRKFQARFLTSSVYGIGVTASQAKFNLKKSLQSGIMIYERDGNLTLDGTLAPGIGVVTSIGVNTNISGAAYYGLMAHEVVHILQYDDMSWLNPMFNKVDVKLKDKLNWYQKTSKYVHADLNSFALLGLYWTQINRPWECRTMERDADIFSNRNVYSSCQ